MNDDATNTKEDKNPAEIVRDKWNDTLKERVEMPAIKMSWQNATVQNHIRQEHLNGHSVTSYLVDFLGGRKLKRGLEVGGGLGH